MFTRAAAHQKTSDNLGVIPDPIIGDVLNFIDAARPLVGALGPRDMPSATWYRPKVTARTLVGVQGSAGAAADEKAELSSAEDDDHPPDRQRGHLRRLRQRVAAEHRLLVAADDGRRSSTTWPPSTPIQTEAALGAALIAGTNNVELTTAVAPAVPTAAELTAALWTAVGNIYNATKGQGRVILAVAARQARRVGSACSLR